MSSCYRKAALFTGCLCILSSTAWAQSGGDQITELDLITTTAGTSSSTTVVLVDLFICPPIRAACEVLSTTSEISWLTSAQSQNMAVNIFLQENAVALSHDIAVGGGAVLADLAALYGLRDEQGRVLGIVLRPRRHALWAILQSGRKIDDAQTRAFTIEVALALGIKVKS